MFNFNWVDKKRIFESHENGLTDIEHSIKVVHSGSI